MGRVRAINTANGQRFAGTIVSIDGTNVGTVVDTTVTLRIHPSAEHPQPSVLRVRRIGLPSAALEFRPDFSKAYPVDIVIAGGSVHSDGFTTVRVREAWMCEAAG